MIKTNKRVLMAHGSGGIASHELVRDIFIKYIGNPVLNDLDDAAVIDNQPGKIAFSTDSYVVEPLVFPGGDIGTIAVHGTLNDLAMRGAEPIALTLAVILEEGLAISELEYIVKSIGRCSKDSGVPIITGDTKVVPKGKCDKIFINTSGIGIVKADINISPTLIKPSDKIILSGSMGDHGITIMTGRAGIEIKSNIKSDSMALHKMIKKILTDIDPNAIHALRDPTRGGVATSLNEMCDKSKLGIEIIEELIPVHNDVHVACEILGLEPLYLANEGKCLAIIDEKFADEVLSIMKSTPEGKEAAIIGSVNNKNNTVVLKTNIGGSRIITPLTDDPLPRIC